MANACPGPGSFVGLTHLGLNGITNGNREMMNVLGSDCKSTLGSTLQVLYVKITIEKTLCMLCDKCCELKFSPSREGYSMQAVGVEELVYRNGEGLPVRGAISFRYKRSQLTASLPFAQPIYGNELSTLEALHSVQFTVPIHTSFERSWRREHMAFHPIAEEIKWNGECHACVEGLMRVADERIELEELGRNVPNILVLENRERIINGYRNVKEQMWKGFTPKRDRSVRHPWISDENGRELRMPPKLGCVKWKLVWVM